MCWRKQAKLGSSSNLAWRDHKHHLRPMAHEEQPVAEDDPEVSGQTRSRPSVFTEWLRAHWQWRMMRTTGFQWARLRTNFSQGRNNGRINNPELGKVEGKLAPDQSRLCNETLFQITKENNWKAGRVRVSFHFREDLWKEKSEYKLPCFYRLY